MKSNLVIGLTTALLGLASMLGAAELGLSEPKDFQVVQRRSANEGTLQIRGRAMGAEAGTFEARLILQNGLGAWQKLIAQREGEEFHGTMKAPAGGWYRLEVRVVQNGAVAGQSTVEHVGIGEVFVVAGQSNSANHGEKRQQTRTKRVAAFDGTRWQLADDPQPGASGNGGSFMPPLGDLLAERFDVPVGFVACGIGATSVREWLPKGAVFPNPPTLEGQVRKRPDGSWESNGEAYAAFVERMKPVGRFRAVLWHQGESDANQEDPARTLPGELYRLYLEKIIRSTRREIGWDVPWFVAQASYHVPGDEASADIRAAQASLWRDGLAVEGPDSDALKGDLRENKGQGVHFNDKGLREHASRWAEKIGPWLEKELRSAVSGK